MQEQKGRRGAIRVGLDHVPPQSVALTVSDDGPGGGGSDLKSGVGTSIIEGLVRQVSGQLTIDTEAGRTTTIVMPQPESA